MTPKKIVITKAENGYLITDPGDPNEYEDPRYWIAESSYKMSTIVDEIFGEKKFIVPAGTVVFDSHGTADNDEEIPC